MIHIPYRLRHCGTSGGCQNIGEDVVLPSFDGDRTSESYNGSFGRGVVCLAEIAVYIILLKTNDVHERRASIQIPTPEAVVKTRPYFCL
jgi:hypothetical protein